MKALHHRWHTQAGYREFLVLALPLILSTGSWSILHFVDRMFLSWYSPETIAASMPAGILNFTLVSLFIGTAGYAGTFVAQYYGAGAYHRIGPVIWQSIYLSLAGALVIMALIPLAGPIFAWVGHAPQVQIYERQFFQILCLGAFPAIASAAASGFFSGLGQSLPVMWVNFMSTLVNIFLDFLLIFGNWGFPELGIVGAGIASDIAVLCSFLCYLALICRHKEALRYHTLTGWRFEWNLFLRLLRYGFPAGVQFALDMAGFTAFVLLIGRLGTTSLAATNIAFNINTLAFMPMLGAGIAISVLVGQYLGQNRPDLAQSAVASGLHITVVYMGLTALLYISVPWLFVGAFAAHAQSPGFGAIADLSVLLLRFVALYSLFDGMTIIFSSALKGAGDTRFVMAVIVILSIGTLIIPTYLAIIYFKAGLFTCWTIATAYIMLLSLILLLRYKNGAWKFMRVIERPAPIIPVLCSETPDARVET